MKFSYEARTPNGEIQTGSVEARTEEAAITTLQRHNLVVVHLQSTKDRSILDLSLSFKSVSTVDLVIFYRQLATLFSAGVSLVESLSVLRSQVTNSYFRSILFQLESDIRAGMSLSKAMARHSDVFGTLYVSVTQSGEQTGELGRVLDYLADHAEKEQGLEAKVRGAMVYPAAIGVIFIIVGTLMMLFVVPQLTSVLLESGQELPLPTKILIFTSDILRNWGILLFVGFAATLFGLWRWLKTEGGSAVWDFWKIKLPIFGTLFKNIYVTRFSENLATLIKGDLPILQALTVTADVVGNSVFHDIIIEARDRVREGEAMSDVLEKYDEFPRIVVQMVRVGERSAHIGELLDKIAAFYGRQVDQTVDNLTTLIEPVMIVILGAAVGGLVSAILLPIYNLASSI